jgi:hypothetical protein
MNYKYLPPIINNFIIIEDLGIKKRRRYLLAKCKKCLRIFETSKDHVTRNMIGCSRACAKNKGGNKRLAKIREGMIARCRNRSHVSFRHYSRNDITVCEEWLNNSASFYKWALANGYSEDLTLDRIDNSKGYYPSNCTWSSKHIQSQNSSQAKLDINKVKEIFSLSKTMQQKDIAILFGVSRSTICSILKGIRWGNVK